MWTHFDTFKCYIPTFNQKITCKKIFYMSLDNGITWNPRGKYHPDGLIYGVNWVWCNEDVKFVANYLKFLIDENILPVFYSSNVNIDYCNILLKNLPVHPFIFLYLDLPRISGILSSNFQTHKNVEFFLTNDNLELIIENEYRLGISDTYGTEITLDSIGLSNLKKIIFEKPQLILLMGSPCCGKTYLSKKLLQSNFYVLDCKECLNIYNGKRSKYIDEFKQLIMNVNSYKTYNGIVLDFMFETKSKRDFFIKIASELNMGYKIIFISFPGVYYDNKKIIKTPSLIHDLYSQYVDIPYNDENFLRII